MNGKELLKILKKHKFKVLRINGSHYILGKENCRPFPIPVHGTKDISKGTLKNIERLSGVKLM